MDDPRTDHPIADEEEPCSSDAWLYPEVALLRGLGGEDAGAGAGDDALRWYYGGTEPPEVGARDAVAAAGPRR